MPPSITNRQTNPQPSTLNPRSSNAAGQGLIRGYITVDQTLDQLWRLLGSREQLSTWLVDDFNVELRVGMLGQTTEDGRRRVIRIDEVTPHARLAFTWRGDEEGSACTVAMALVQ